MRRAFWIATTFALALAITLRFARLRWGLDDNLWFFDETMWMVYLQSFKQLDWKAFDTTALLYPTLYRLVGGVGAWAVGRLGWSIDGVAAIAWMRGVAATASVVSVLVTARLGLAMFGPWVGAAAGALLAVAPLEVMQVHYASVEPLLVLCTVLVMASSWRLMQQGTLAAAGLAGFSTGLAMGAKYTGLAFVSAVAWAIGERWWRDRSIAATLRLGAASALAVAVGFALSCPSCLIHADVMLKTLVRHRQMAEFAGFAGACLVPRAGWWHRPWLYEVTASLPYGMGLAFAVSGFVGVVVALRYRTAADRLILATLLPYFAYMGASYVVYPRYMLPLFPAFALLATSGLARLARPRPATAVAALVVTYGLAVSASQLGRFSWAQQAAVADWMGDRLPALAPDSRRVQVPAFEPSDPYYRLRAPLEAKGYAVETGPPAKWWIGRPPFFVMPDWLAMTIIRDGRDFLLRARLMALQAGSQGYRPVLHVPVPDYVQRAWNVSWDPTFAVELWQGAIGFVVYARNDLLPELRTVEVLPALPPPRAETPDPR